MLFTCSQFSVPQSPFSDVIYFPYHVFHFSCSYNSFFSTRYFLFHSYIVQYDHSLVYSSQHQLACYFIQNFPGRSSSGQLLRLRSVQNDSADIAFQKVLLTSKSNLLDSRDHFFMNAACALAILVFISIVQYSLPPLVARLL